jgi:hypothetical protein
MSEQDKGKEKEQKLTIEVDRSSEIAKLQEELKRIEAEAKKAKEEAEHLAKEKEAIEQEKANLLSEKEELQGALTTIAEKEYNAKKEAIMKRVKGVFSEDDKRLKDIEEKLNDPEKGPENIKEVEFMVGVLEDAMKKGKEEIEKLKKAEEEKAKQQLATSPPPAPVGGTTAMLNEKQLTGGKKEEEGYESYEAMIRDLRAKARDTSNPEKQAEAEAILKELFKKWAITLRDDLRKKTNAAPQVEYESREKVGHKEET